MLTMPPVFNAGDTIYFPFDTYDSNGASVTITGLAVTDIEVYKNGSTTQRASDNGYTLLDTDGIDFDGSTGLHGFSIDTSDNSDASFWADGAQYWVHVNAITVDGQTVRFTYILPLGFLLRPTTAGRKLDVSTGGEAGIDWANVGNPTSTVGLSGTTVGTVTTTTTATTLTNDPGGVTTLLTRVPSGIFTGITSLAQWLGLIAGKQVGNTTARTEIRATGAGSGTYDETADSQEAIRDRGDAEWITGGASSAPTAEEIAAVIFAWRVVRGIPLSAALTDDTETQKDSVSFHAAINMLFSRSVGLSSGANTGTPTYKEGGNGSGPTRCIADTGLGGRDSVTNIVAETPTEP